MCPSLHQTIPCKAVRPFAAGPMAAQRRRAPSLSVLPDSPSCTAADGSMSDGHSLPAAKPTLLHLAALRIEIESRPHARHAPWLDLAEQGRAGGLPLGARDGSAQATSHRRRSELGLSGVRPWATRHLRRLGLDTAQPPVHESCGRSEAEVDAPQPTCDARRRPPQDSTVLVLSRALRHELSLESGASVHGGAPQVSCRPHDSRRGCAGNAPQAGRCSRQSRSIRHRCRSLRLQNRRFVRPEKGKEAQR
jgi:hypothetical protein